jgi:serine/threonine protein kinase
MSLPPPPDYEYVSSAAHGTKLVRHLPTHSLRICRSIAVPRSVYAPRALQEAQPIYNQYSAVTDFIFLKYLDAVDTPHHYFILSEPVPPGAIDLATLISRWRGRAPSEVHVLYIFSQLLLAFDRLHSRSPALVHGNLTPHNVFVTPGNVLRLAEFGLRKIVGPIRKLADDYARVPAPEESLGQCDIRSDVWAIGAIVYQLCTGLPLTVVEPIERVSEDLNALILQMLSEDPDERPTVEDIAATPFMQSYFDWFLSGGRDLRIPKSPEDERGRPRNELGHRIPWSGVETPDDRWERMESGTPPPRDWRQPSRMSPLRFTVKPELSSREQWVVGQAVTSCVTEPLIMTKRPTRFSTSLPRPRTVQATAAASAPLIRARNQKPRESEGRGEPSWARALPRGTRSPGSPKRLSVHGDTEPSDEVGDFKSELRRFVERLSRSQDSD